MTSARIEQVLYSYPVPAEAAVLGSVLLDRDVMTALAPMLTPAHFGDIRHELIWDVMEQLYRRRVPCDVQTVADELRQHHQLEDTGGVPYLIELSNTVPTAYHAAYYADIVIRRATLRRLAAAGQKITKLAAVETDDVSALLADAQALLAEADARVTDRGATTLSDAISEEYEYLSSVMEGRAHAGIRTGHIDYDRMTGGLHRSDLTVTAARPGAGKTSLMLTRALTIATGGTAVGVFSLEMSRRQLLIRAVALRADINASHFRSGMPFSDEHIRDALDAMGELSNVPLIIDDTAGLTITDVRNRARRMTAEHEIGVLFVDYLQLISDPAYAGKRTLEVGSVARGLKALAKELDIPVVALAQLNRGTEGRAVHVPALADLRDSGEIEQEADLVEFIYRPEMYDRQTDRKGVAEIHIEKARHGPTGVISLVFDAATTRFQNYAPGERA